MIYLTTAQYKALPVHDIACNILSIPIGVKFIFDIIALPDNVLVEGVGITICIRHRGDDVAWIDGKIRNRDDRVLI